MRKNVLVFRPIPDDLLARIESEHDVIVADPRQPTQRPAFRAALANAHGLIGSSVKLGAVELADASRLEVISSISVGVDNYDLPCLHRRGITLCHTPGVLTETTADTVFALIMATSRRLVELAAHVSEGRWTANIGESLFGWDVHGKTLAILGFGRIGQAVARRAALGFGMEVVYVNETAAEPPDLVGRATWTELDDALHRADIVAVTLPLTDSTRGLMGRREFALMKPGAIFVNGARGQIVQEDALLAALDSGHLRAAGLDVFATEPLPQDSPLRSHPKVTALPHIGSATHETRRAMADLATRNLLDALAGRQPVARFDLAAFAVQAAA
ncbi:2-ketogluconate 6-phosphate reductase [Cupriavidus necator H850]|uniref:2-hydroxyacid dehydrogenase n=1 Tax=Cupriavidus necator TaxID=106590 RepID=UPI00129E2CB7|nr:D-glycerate dehydrogenase [Cupriavidus necator]KAI3595699.1 2-ketogluconate 6-phosphate reductase [Cupriavidus necator H850]